MTHDSLLLEQKGKCIVQKGMIPEYGKNGKGVPIINLLEVKG